MDCVPLTCLLESPLPPLVIHGFLQLLSCFGLSAVLFSMLRGKHQNSNPIISPKPSFHVLLCPAASENLEHA